MNRHISCIALLLAIAFMTVRAAGELKKSSTTMVPTAREKVLHNFNFNDGAAPVGSLIFDSAGNLYSSTFEGGNQSCSDGCGTVFQLVPGTNGKWTEKVLYSFRGGKDGASPLGSLIFDPTGNIYGTTTAGGNGNGTVFELVPGTNGKWIESVIYTFHGKDGSFPIGSLTFGSGGILFGTTAGGGDYKACPQYGCGIAFKLTPNSSGQWAETVLHRFNGNDGRSPNGNLIFDAAGDLYGTTAEGGYFSQCLYGCGTAFMLSPGQNGTWTETVLHRFGLYVNTPVAGLVFDSLGNLYGTTGAQGAQTYGIVFKLSSVQRGTWTMSVLHTFHLRQAGTPFAGVIFDKAGNLYGTTIYGHGTNSYGTVFKLHSKVDGKWALSILHTFNNTDGNLPDGGVIFDGKGNLYGSTFRGGDLRYCPGNGCGVVYEITP